MHRIICFLLPALLFLAAFESKAQNESDLKGYGKAVFEDLIQKGVFDTVSMIRLREYRDFVRERVTSENEQNRIIHELDAHFLDRFPLYERTIYHLRDSYQEAAAKGAEVTYMETVSWEKEEALPDTYSFIISFLYKDKEVQSEVRLKFDAVWYLGTFLLISHIEEDF